ncbi:MAG: anaerobic sulfatase maturase [Anaerolineae bacterium]|nr:anaerobic sulfatase maturase [Anaerolineae bacterium]
MVDLLLKPSERAWQPPGFTVMVKPRGPVCNLNCSHCYYLSKENLFLGSSFRMTDDVLEDFTRQYLEAQAVPEVNFVWQGGEPILMGLAFFQKAVALQKKYARPGVHVVNSFQTNGTLVTPEWARFFHQNNFLVGISIDGPAEIHNRYRVDKMGNPSFDDVIRGLRCLQEHQVEHNVLTCVSVNNADRGRDVYRYFRDELGIRYMQFIPIVERDNNTGYQEGGAVTSRTITPQQYAGFLIDVFTEWVRNDVGRVFVQIFDTTLASWVGERPGLCVFEPTCGLGLVVEHNGDVFSCDHYVEPRHRLGNFMEDGLANLVFNRQQYRFGMDKRESLTRYCRECPWLFACNGGCPKNRIRRSPDGEEGQNYLCRAYQEFFAFVDKPMRIMANLIRDKKAPAEIMSIIRSNEREVLLPGESQSRQPKSNRRRH